MNKIKVLFITGGIGCGYADPSFTLPWQGDPSELGYQFDQFPQYFNNKSFHIVQRRNDKTVQEASMFFWEAEGVEIECHLDGECRYSLKEDYDPDKINVLIGSASLLDCLTANSDIDLKIYFIYKKAEDRFKDLIRYWDSSLGGFERVAVKMREEHDTYLYKLEDFYENGLARIIGDNFGQESLIEALKILYNIE